MQVKRNISDERTLIQPNFKHICKRRKYCDCYFFVKLSNLAFKEINQ